MSIAPPSDIVLDVARAADPQRLLDAQAKLARIAAGAASGDFDAAAGGVAPTPFRAPVLPQRFEAPPSVAARPLSPYQKFEAVLLQNLVDNILPRESSLFGDATSADVNRSMLAEQLASQIARTGRLGIARMIEKAHPPAAGPGLNAPSLSANPSPDLTLTTLAVPKLPRRAD